MQLNERYKTESTEEKAQVLIRMLQNHIVSNETNNEPLYETDNAAWRKHMMAIGTIYVETGQLNEQIKAAEALIKYGTEDSSHKHALAGLLTKRGDPGDFKRAEGLELPFKDTVDNQLGKDSPQSLSSRRIIAKAIWMQNRQSEAKTLIAEIYGLIDDMAKGKFSSY
jgi:hypothetical protein